MATTVLSTRDHDGVLEIVASGDAPEGNVTAPPGTILMHKSGVTYTKKIGTGNTGWVSPMQIPEATMGACKAVAELQGWDFDSNPDYILLNVVSPPYKFPKVQ